MIESARNLLNPIKEIRPYATCIVKEITTEDGDEVVRLDASWLQKKSLYVYLVTKPGSYKEGQVVQVFQITRFLEFKGRTPANPMEKPYENNIGWIWGNTSELVDNFIAMPLDQEQGLLRQEEIQDLHKEVLNNSDQVNIVPDY